MPTKVTKAIFPVAGMGTRFLPATKSVPKEIMTLVDRPLVQYAMDEARAAGIKEFLFVTSRGKGALEDYFDSAPQLEQALREKGKTELLNILKSTNMDSGEIAYMRQHKALGLGHAVWCARRLIGNEPFAVILPDDVIAAEKPCLQQMVEAFEKTQSNIARRYGRIEQGRILLRYFGHQRGYGRFGLDQRHGRKASCRYAAVEFGRNRPLHPDADGDAHAEQKAGWRWRRDPVDGCHRGRAQRG